MINVITTFSGYDSQCLALRKAGIDFNLVAWAEFDPQSKQPLEKQPAVIAHNLLFPEYRDRNLGDMAKADWQRFKGIDIDLFTYSFPCTDISQAGLMKGLSKDSGTRSSCLWYCEAAISTLRPKYLLMENVKNLVSKKFMPDFMQWYDVLQELGYTNYWKVMNAKDYGVPQNRERECLWCQFAMTLVGTHLPSLHLGNSRLFLQMFLKKMPTKVSSLKTRWLRSSSATTKRRARNLFTRLPTASLQRMNCKRY